MMIGIVSRLTDQKGFDLIAYVMDEMCQDAVQFCDPRNRRRALRKLCSVILDWKYHGKGFCSDLL